MIPSMATTTTTTTTTIATIATVATTITNGETNSMIIVMKILTVRRQVMTPQ